MVPSPSPPPPRVTLLKKFTHVRFMHCPTIPTVQPNPNRYAVGIGKIPIWHLLQGTRNLGRYFRQILTVQISFGDPVKNCASGNKWTKWTGHKLDWLPFNKPVTPDFSNFVLTNMSQSKELRYFVFHYSSMFDRKKQVQNEDQFTNHFWR